MAGSVAGDGQKLMSERKTAFAGDRLLKLSAWIRSQPWLKSIYVHVPASVRNRVSETLAANANEQFKFGERGTRRHPPAQREKQILRSEYAGAHGVNIFAYARGQFGLGEAARHYARALIAEGYPVAIYDIDLAISHGMNDTSVDSYIDQTAPYGINLFFVNPDYLDEAMQKIGRDRLENRYTIACWFWELERFPDEWMSALECVDEIMVPTNFIQGMLEKVTKKPIWLVPLPIGELDDSELTRSDFGLNEGDFVFLNSFDFNSFLARKNPLAVINAFKKAFTNEQVNVKLLIKSSNGHRHPGKLQQLLAAASGDARIVVRDEVINRSDMQALQRCSDAYVSLHRAEGFGLGLAECMRLRKPVIATAWSGNMQFMTPNNSFLVDYHLVPVGRDEYIHHAGQRWAEPDINSAAEHMRSVVFDRDLAAMVAAKAEVDIEQMLSPRLAAQNMIHRFECQGSSRIQSGHL